MEEIRINPPSGRATVADGRTTAAGVRDTGEADVRDTAAVLADTVRGHVSENGVTGTAGVRCHWPGGCVTVSGVSDAGGGLIMNDVK